MQMILGKASKTDMIRVFGQLPLDRIVQGDYPSVGKLSRSFGLEKAEKAIGILLYDLSSSFDGALDKDQVQEICAEISSSVLRNLSLEDVYLVCRRIKHSNQYGKLSTNKVLAALSQHLDERSNAAYTYNLNKHLSSKFVDNDRQSSKRAMKAQFHQAKLWYIQQHNQELRIKNEKLGK